MRLGSSSAYVSETHIMADLPDRLSQPSSSHPPGEPQSPSELPPPLSFTVGWSRDGVLSLEDLFELLAE